MATRWRLESCPCVVTYDGLNGDTPINPTVEHDCGAHGADLSPADHFAKVLAFNRAWTAARRDPAG